MKASKQMEVYLEVGSKKTFAGAVDWPGWARSGRDEESALQALLESGPTYAKVVEKAGLEFHVPVETPSLVVVERLEGGSATDFGVLASIPSCDTQPVNETEMARLQSLLEACCQAFEQAVQQAEGQELRKGPRGGGRELDGMIRHVLEANAGYRSQLGWKKKDEAADTAEAFKFNRQALREALEQAVRGELPAQGPRGGKHWPPRYFVRRVAWHILDHTWELEDRIIK